MTRLERSPAPLHSFNISSLHAPEQVISRGKDSVLNELLCPLNNSYFNTYPKTPSSMARPSRVGVRVDSVSGVRKPLVVIRVMPS